MGLKPNRQSQASTASALAKMLRREGVNSLYYGITDWDMKERLDISGDGVFCIGAQIRYQAADWFHPEYEGPGEVERIRDEVCGVLEGSGRYAHKTDPVEYIEGAGYTFWIHVESLRYIRSPEAETNTCFPHLR